MNQIIDAIFENGMFKPMNAPDVPLSEGQQVRLVVEITAETPDDLLQLAAHVYNGLSSEEISQVERIALDRGNFFGDESSS